MTDVLDLRGLKCPMPALMARRAVLRAPAGSLIELICDDPLASLDVPHMCRQEGFELVSLAREGAITRAVIRRSSSERSG